MLGTKANQSSQPTKFRDVWGKEAGFYKQVDRQAYVGLKLGDCMAAVTGHALNPYLAQLDNLAHNGEID